MLARHRQSLILAAIRNDGSARVSDLTQQLGVSEMTIRRDLEVLAKDGLVEKVHGGATLPGVPERQEKASDLAPVPTAPDAVDKGSGLCKDCGNPVPEPRL